MYFGGGQTLEAATPLQLGAGAEVEANFSLKLQPSHKIRGALEGFVAHQSAVFELMAGEEDVSPSRVTVNSETGRFEIQDVLPGAYVLRATQGQASGGTAVTVAGGDVSGVTVTLEPAVEVKGNTRFTNVPPGETPEVLHERLSGGLCQAVLHRGEKTVMPQYGEDGAFTISNVPPGRYRVTVQCFGGYANSVTAGRQDLLAEPFLTVGAGTPAMEIVATHGGGTVQATVAAPDTDGGNAQVLLVPNFASTGPVLEQVGGAEGVRELVCGIGGLAPGVYTAYALPMGVDVPFRDAAFLATLTGGVTVQVEDQTEKQIRLEVRR